MLEEEPTSLGVELAEKNDHFAMANLLKEREGRTWFNRDTQSECLAFSLTRIPRHSPRHHPHRPYHRHSRNMGVLSS